MVLHFDGIVNARTLDGLAAADGKRVRAGLLLRGAGLHAASDADLARLRGELRLRHIVDFRDGNECARSPDRAVAGAAYHHLPALPDAPAQKRQPEEAVRGAELAAVFRRIYSELAESDRAAAAYGAFFRILLRCEGPVWFHCTQGKDRTGVAALLLLSALGVPDEAALADYFASNEGLRAAKARMAADGGRRWAPDALERLFTVDPDFIDLWRQKLEASCGGPAGYLRARLGLTEADFETLRAFYLE